MKNNPDRPCYLEVTVDKDIMLYGVAMFAGNKYIDDCYSVTLQALNNDDSVVAAKSGTFLPFQVESEADHPSYYGFDVLFEAPVTLRKDVQYCFEASIDGPTSICEGRFVNDIRCAGVSFNFKQPGANVEIKIDEWSKVYSEDSFYYMEDELDEEVLQTNESAISPVPLPFTY
ncbi:hypothetical protein OS493_015265 [Desmophyllum pertusum]|uniref:PHR domain-containing protein n=1 Tax=Desmophyllum pertusum TaxID=174260 RepID=A0A9X0CXD9_9CNID|nr:hypothetical protein OS493_015265 [Desmophyllum pertusum]